MSVNEKKQGSLLYMGAAFLLLYAGSFTRLLDNLVLESTGVLQKTRIYEMSSNQTFLRMPRVEVLF